MSLYALNVISGILAIILMIHFDVDSGKVRSTKAGLEDFFYEFPKLVLFLIVFCAFIPIIAFLMFLSVFLTILSALYERFDIHSWLAEPALKRKGKKDVD